MKIARARWEEQNDAVIDDLLSTFSNVVRDHRIRLGLSQEELGARSGLHRTYISDIETGVRPNLSMKSLCRLAYALNLTPAELLQNMQTAALLIRSETPQLVRMDSLDAVQVN